MEEAEKTHDKNLYQNVASPPTFTPKKWGIHSYDSDWHEPGASAGGTIGNYLSISPLDSTQEDNHTNVRQDLHQRPSAMLRHGSRLQKLGNPPSHSRHTMALIFFCRPRL